MKNFKYNYAYIILINEIDIVISRNNNKIFTSKNCPFSNYVSRKSNIFRYNLKLNVGKCFHCGKSFKDKKKLVKLLKNKIDVKSRSFENVYYCDDLPF